MSDNANGKKREEGNYMARRHLIRKETLNTDKLDHREGYG